MADLFKGVNKKYKISAKARIGLALKLNVRGLNIIDINNRIKKAIDRASATVSIELKNALDEALRSNTWQTLQGTADIYDTGELLESGKVIVTPTSITVSYDAPYAALVHYGGYILPYGNTSAAKVYLPPRPWVEAVLNGGGPVPRFDFEQHYRRELEKEFS